jgi:nicotinamidase-related amidase
MSDSKLDFTLNPAETAIVVIDLQKGIAQLPGAPLPMTTVIANTVRLLAAARRAGAQPVLVHVSLSPDGADRLNPVADQQPRMSGAMPPDWSELLPELDRLPSDLVILKRQWGAFYGTDLELQLRRRSLTTVVLCGVATEFGVESTARCAYELGFQLVFASDAMTGMHPDSHTNAIERIFPRIGRVRTTDLVIAALQS